MILLKSIFLSMSTSLFQYSSNISLSSCLMLKNWARLWNTFLAGMIVFLNNFSSSDWSTSISSLPHSPLMISCLALGPSAQITSPLCDTLYAGPSVRCLGPSFRPDSDCTYSEICSYHIRGKKSKSCNCFSPFDLLLFGSSLFGSRPIGPFVSKYWALSGYPLTGCPLNC